MISNKNTHIFFIVIECTINVLVCLWSWFLWEKKPIEMLICKCLFISMANRNPFPHVRNFRLFLLWCFFFFSFDLKKIFPAQSFSTWIPCHGKAQFRHLLLFTFFPCQSNRKMNKCENALDFLKRAIGKCIHVQMDSPFFPISYIMPFCPPTSRTKLCNW